MLDKLGLTEDDVSIVNSDIDKGYQAFTSGSADVLFVSGTYTTMLEEDSGYTCCHTMAVWTPPWRATSSAKRPAPRTMRIRW